MESVGQNFNLDSFFKARELTIQAVDRISQNTFVGMSEEQGHELIDQILNEMGSERKWHPNKFRIGKNTLKSFREKSDPDIRMQENDIYFVDIGPVFLGHEGDYGKTFVKGDDQEFIAASNACIKVFKEVESEWKRTQLTGLELYEYASKVSTELGFELNTSMNGHRIGDFPHAVHFKGKLGEINISPKENIWILEILLKHPSNEYGSFFEDILVL